MRRVPVGQFNEALVDDDDYALACTRVWSLQRHPYTAYAVSNAGAQGPFVFLHRLIAREMGISGAVDHKNGDGLDCQRSNLRAASKSQNAANLKHLYAHNQSGYRGVAPSGRPSRPWRARIEVNGKARMLGRYRTIEEAIDAYNAAAIQAWGDFAYTNPLPRRAEWAVTGC